MTNVERHKVWLEISSRDDLPIIHSWLDENTPDNFYWFWVPASARRRVEFIDKTDAHKFRTFLRNEGIYVFDEGAI